MQGGFIAAACGLVLTAGLLSAEDVVTFSSAANRRARSRVRGEVLEYTGKQVVIQLADGREMKRPGQYVVSIETEWPPGKAEGDQLFDAQHFHAARDKYADAIHKESRGWARRAIFARLIACHRELNQLEAADKLFLALARDDPETPYFDQLPLSWLNAELSGTLEKTAKQWLADEEPLAQLLAASHLLVTLDRQEALDRLATLSLSKDPRIASQAEAQIWRVSIPNANDQKLAVWRRRVETFPENLRAGPYWILGRALAQHGHAEDAALAFLHVPLVYPEARSLAADALYAAAGILAKLGDEAAAQRLRRELAATFPGTPAADQVRSLLPPDEQFAPPTPPAPPAVGDTLEQTFLNALRTRRLFALAERHCRGRLAEADLAEAMRVNLAVELSRSLAEHALHETQDKRETLWKEAVAAVRQPPGEAIRGSRRLLLEAQAAMVYLTQGELARQEAELAGADEASFDAARQELRAAVGLFDDTLKEVGDALRQAGPARQTAAADLNEGDLAALTRNLRYQLARAFRNQGQSYPAKSADRTNSLRQAEERLKLLAAADADDAIAWPARLDEVTCLRLLEQFSAAQARLANLRAEQPPVPFPAALLAEQIRLAIDQGQLNDALAAAEQARAAADMTADLQLACLESYVAAWQAAAKAKHSTEAAALQEQAAELIGEIDSRFGRYWSRRAEMLLAGSVARGGGTENLAVLVRAAESLFRSGQFAQSLEAYDRAARQAASANQADAAFDYAFTAAAIEQQLKKHAAAAGRFRQLALGAPRHNRAGEAHLLAIYNSALAADKNDKDAVNDYRDLLREHIAEWPRSPTADQVRLWLGELCERERGWSDAIDAYRGVRFDGPQATAAVEGLARSYRRWLADLSAAGEATAETAARAAKELEAFVVNSRGDLPERWSRLERIAAVSAATIYLTYGEHEFARAERLLRAALNDAADAPEEWRATAQTLEVFAVAAQGQRAEAAKLLNDLAGGEPAQMFGLIEGLAKVAAQTPPKVARELAELQLRAAKLLGDRLKELPTDQQNIFRRARLRALVMVGRHAEALQDARKLADESPRDGQMQEQYAELLLASTDRASQQAALAKWRDIGRKTRQGSDRWVRAMYAQTLALTNLGEKQQAERLIKLTQAISPELGGPEMKSKFRALATRTPQRESKSSSK